MPIFRAFDEDVNFGESLKKMTGSTRDVIDPLESIVKNTYSFIRRAELNKARKCNLFALARYFCATSRRFSAFESRDLTDFGRQVKPHYNNAVDFANASIQGWDKFIRTYDVQKAW